MRTLDVEPRHLVTTIEGMELGFSGPLLRDYRIPGLRIAGKTGTAEYGQATNPQGELPTHGWFTGFAPVDDPKVVVTVFVERGSSTRDAAPIATRIIRHIFGAPDVPPKPPGQPTPGPAPAPRRPGAGPPTGRRAGRPDGQPSPGQHGARPGQPRPPAPVNAAPPPPRTAGTRARATAAARPAGHPPIPAEPAAGDRAGPQPAQPAPASKPARAQ